MAIVDVPDTTPPPPLTVPQKMLDLLTYLADDGVDGVEMVQVYAHDAHRMRVQLTPESFRARFAGQEVEVHSTDSGVHHLIDTGRISWSSYDHRPASAPRKVTL